MRSFKSIYWAPLIASVVLLSACTRSVSDVDSRGSTRQPIFPAVGTTVSDQGIFVNVNNLKQIRTGLTKSQLRHLIGSPHFKEGMLRVKEWDYIFHFTKKDNRVMTCQYKVLFDSDMLARNFYYKPADCLSQVAAGNEPEKRKYRELNAEALFAFSSAKLSASGQERIRQLARHLMGDTLNGKRIVVTGHTDRIGNSAENLQLSLQRAVSVRLALIQNGVPAAMIDVRGMGDTMPKVQCSGGKSPAIIRCLAPNRRITVDIIDYTSGE